MVILSENINKVRFLINNNTVIGNVDTLSMQVKWNGLIGLESYVALLK